MNIWLVVTQQLHSQLGWRAELSAEQPSKAFCHSVGQNLFCGAVGQITTTTTTTNNTREYQEQQQQQPPHQHQQYVVVENGINQQQSGSLPWSCV
jgi:antitoxin component of MazEF toxin-antitoxin module